VVIEEGGVKVTVRKGQPVTVEKEPDGEIEKVAELKAPKGAEYPDHWKEIVAPMVGTFYRAPAPGAPPFVEVGDTVEPGQTVCIVEAMKLMNEITAEEKGIIKKILVENAEPVEYGQPLFLYEPIE
jgi:acetyl-CoA carboxylase biotin carboxyl carrier protein